MDKSVRNRSNYRRIYLSVITNKLVTDRFLAVEN